MAWSPDSQHLVSATTTWNQTQHHREYSLIYTIWDRTLGQPTQVITVPIQANENDPLTLAWRTTEPQMISITTDKSASPSLRFHVSTISSTTAPTDTAWATERAFAPDYRSNDAILAISPDATMFATVSNFSTTLWGFDGTMIRDLPTINQNNNRTLAWSPNGTFLATSQGEGEVILWDTATGKPQQTISAHASWIDGLAWNSDGTVLITGADEGVVGFWNATTGEQMYSIPKRGDPGDVSVRTIVSNPTTNAVAILYGNNSIGIWNAVTHTPIQDFNVPEAKSIAWSPDGTALAILTEQSRIELWEAE